MRIPIATQLHIEDFSGGAVNVKTSGTVNCIYDKRPNGSVFATQRPGINISEDCSAASVVDVQGRGIYYWNAVSAKYIVNNGTVYKTSYSGTTMTLSAGLQRVDMFEVGSYLVLVDSENNEAWTINSSASTTLTQITDTDFPSEQTPALTLAKGGASLNNTMYVAATDGTIWNSAVENPTSWTATGFTSAEVKQDGIVAIYEHANHIAAFGTSTIEFFYDNANATGSPLNVRQDIFHELGLANFHSAWVQVNTITFVGQHPSGSLGVYRMTNFVLEKLSEPDFDTMLTSALNEEGASCVGYGFVSGGRSFYCLTIYNEDSSAVSPVATYVHDSMGGWHEWELAHDGIDDFPIVSWTKATSTRQGEGVLSNGDLITIRDNFIPQDTTEASAYITSGYVVDGYVVSTGAAGTNIDFEIITGQGDSGTMRTKFADGLKVICSPTNASESMTVQWSDESNSDYNTGKTIDVSNPKNRINRLGSYKFRNYKLSGSFTEKVEVEGLEVDVSVG